VLSDDAAAFVNALNGKTGIWRSSFLSSSTSQFLQGIFISSVKSNPINNKDDVNN
jgi:hypothetical protein